MVSGRDLDLGGRTVLTAAYRNDRFCMSRFQIAVTAASSIAPPTVKAASWGRKYWSKPAVLYCELSWRRWYVIAVSMPIMLTTTMAREMLSGSADGRFFAGLADMMSDLPELPLFDEAISVPANEIS
jgi:uncharacterized protein YbaR (Trm112 family)